MFLTLSKPVVILAKALLKSVDLGSLYLGPLVNNFRSLEFPATLKWPIIICLWWESMNGECSHSQRSVFKVNKISSSTYIELTVSL